MSAAEQQFQWAVQALAQPANVQPTLFPSFVVVADELALEFDHWMKVAGAEVGASWSPVQRGAVTALDRLLAEMSGPGKPEFWLGEACLHHPIWSEVRQLASEVLFAFGWSPGLPPLGRAIYIKAAADDRNILDK
jgi:hypothetical protein